MNIAGTTIERVPKIIEKAPLAITHQMQTGMDYLVEYDEMTDEELKELLNVKKTRTYLIVRQMHENGLIDIIGRGAAKEYKLGC